MSTLLGRIFGYTPEQTPETIQDKQDRILRQGLTTRDDILYALNHGDELIARETEKDIAIAEAHDYKMNREFVKEYKEKEAAKAKKEVTSDTKPSEGKHTAEVKPSASHVEAVVQSAENRQAGKA